MWYYHVMMVKSLHNVSWYAAFKFSLYYYRSAFGFSLLVAKL